MKLENLTPGGKCAATLKVPFYEKQAAEAERKKLQRRGAKGKRLNVYRCDAEGGCDAWHVGHRPEGLAQVGREALRRGPKPPARRGGV